MNHVQNKSLIALVGMKHRGTEAAVRALPAGEIVTLRREPTNAFDANAVMVIARGQHVGYLAARQVVDIAARMDRMGTPEIKAKLALQPDAWPLIEIDG